MFSIQIIFIIKKYTSYKFKLYIMCTHLFKLYNILISFLSVDIVSSKNFRKSLKSLKPFPFQASSIFQLEK